MLFSIHSCFTYFINKKKRHTIHTNVLNVSFEVVHIDGCITNILQKVYKPCKDTTKKLHRDVQETLWQLNRDHGTSKLSWWSKNYYNKLLPTGNSSPAPRFYGLPKIHKANCPHVTHSLSLVGWLPTSSPSSWPKSSKGIQGLPLCLSRTASVSASIWGLSTLVKMRSWCPLTYQLCSQVYQSPTALDVINHLFTEHIEVPEAKGKYGWSFEQNTIGLTKDEVMKLLKLVLENCVFSFQGNFFKQLHGAAMGSPCSPVVANIYMEYSEDMTLGLELPLPIKEWKRYMDDVFSIISKGQCDTMLQYLNFIDPHINIHCRTTKWGGSNPFLGYSPQTQRWGDICLSLQETHTHWQVLGFQLKLPYFSQKSHGKGPHG